jgi:flagellar biosynthesis GTPase FlhF
LFKVRGVGIIKTNKVISHNIIIGSSISFIRESVTESGDFIFKQRTINKCNVDPSSQSILITAPNIDALLNSTDISAENTLNDSDVNGEEDLFPIQMLFKVRGVGIKKEKKKEIKLKKERKAKNEKKEKNKLKKEIKAKSIKKEKKKEIKLKKERKAKNEKKEKNKLKKEIKAKRDKKEKKKEIKLERKKEKVVKENALKDLNKKSAAADNLSVPLYVVDWAKVSLYIIH